MKAATNVVAIRQPASPITVVPHPQVLTDDLVKRLRILNHQVRWMRANNHEVLSINLRAFRPTLVVSETAANLLVAVGHGKLTVRRIGQDPVHSVVIAGCKFQWQDTAPA